MPFRKTLATIVLATCIGVPNVACRVDHSRYSFDGKIGNDYVKFEEQVNLFGDINCLTVTKPDGRKIKYCDATDDLKLEYVRIISQGKEMGFAARDNVGKQVIEEAQKQFDNYLLQIEKKKTEIESGRLKHALEDLK